MKHFVVSSYILCKIHALYLVVEIIRNCYLEVHDLIADTKAVFQKLSRYLFKNITWHYLINFNIFKLCI